MQLATRRVVKKKVEVAKRKVKAKPKRKDRTKENYQTARRRTRKAKEQGLEKIA